LHPDFRPFLLAYVLYGHEAKQTYEHEVHLKTSQAAILFSVLLHCQYGPVVFMPEELTARPEIQEFLASVGWRSDDMPGAVRAELMLHLEPTGMILPSGDVFMVGPGFYKLVLKLLEPASPFRFAPDELLAAVDKELKRRAELTAG
jgi:hypothetical protein